MKGKRRLFPNERMVSVYQPGDKVKYKTAKWHFKNGQESGGDIKAAVVEERFSTIDRRYCYWLAGERQLILENQILGKC